MERLVDVVLLVLRATDENYPAAVALGALGDARHAPSLHRMIILDADRNGILCTLEENQPTSVFRQDHLD